MHDNKFPRVVLITHGRFHSFNLAEQLQNAGLLKAIFTPYPKFKLRNTRVDPALIHSFPWISGLHRVVAGQPVPAAWKHSVQRWSGQAIDWYANTTGPDCDILMSLSGGGLASGRAVQARGGRYICDRGSTHQRYQMLLLADEYSRVGIPFMPLPERSIVREEHEYAQADAITVPSRFAARSFIECGVAASKVHVIPYGVDLDHFSRRAPRDSSFRILFVGQLGVRKGIGYLLKAFRRASIPGAQLVLAGSSSSETKALLQGDNLKDVEFPGILTREGVALEMSRASVLVLPSIEEGLAMVQAEALACGCPVIATANSGAVDLFEHGKEGFIVPIRDPDSIAAALVKLHQDKSLLDHMSHAARARALQLGGWRVYGNAVIALFKQLQPDS